MSVFFFLLQNFLILFPPGAVGMVCLLVRHKLRRTLGSRGGGGNKWFQVMWLMRRQGDAKASLGMKITGHTSPVMELEASLLPTELWPRCDRTRQEPTNPSSGKSLEHWSIPCWTLQSLLGTCLLWNCSPLKVQLLGRAWSTG